MAILWGCTLYNLPGIKASSRLNILGALLGTLLPGTLIIILGIVWWFTHPHNTAHLAQQWQHTSIFHLGSLAILIGTLSGYSGMQITAFHAQDVKQPARAISPRQLP